MPHCETIIIGASFYGCGLAIGLGKAKILEPSILPGAEFSLALNPGSGWEKPLQSPEARNLRAELQQRRAVNDDGQAQIAAFSPVLADCCLKQGLAIEFSCAVIEQQGNLLRVLGVDGLKEIQAEKIINAQPDKTGKEKFLFGLISFRGSLSSGIQGAFHFCPSAREGEAYLRLSLPGPATWPEARQRFHTAWDQRPAALRPSQLLLLATVFTWPGGDDNPALAFDRGIGEGRTQQ